MINPPVEVQCGFPMCGQYSGDSRFCFTHEQMIREWAQYYADKARREQREKDAAIVMKLLNACDRYEPLTDADALKEALREIQNA